MRIEAFDYDLPEDRIAQEPASERDSARLLAHCIATGLTEHRRVRDLVEYLRPGDLLVVNDTRVLQARLLGRRASGGRVEFLLLEPVAGGAARGERWKALVNPARKLKPGETVEVEGGAFSIRTIARGAGPDGKPAKEWQVEILAPTDSSAAELLETHGRVPLPPYIRRGTERVPLDRERYQTVFAARPGAVAAPTAGLHFTPELLARLEELGVQRTAVTLHVGQGTFEPVKVQEVERHRMHAERFLLDPVVADAVHATRQRGGRVVCVGTTSVRVLESCADPERRGLVVPRSGETDLFLYPGRPLQVVDALLTNFHLPRSSLLLLVSTFAGRERILALYREAVERRYRFFSYGDAMFLYGRSSGASRS